MKKNIKKRVLELIDSLNQMGSEKVTVRSFCLDNHINYVSLFNAFKNDAMGIGLIDSFKKAVPNLNLNWFLYEEGDIFTLNEKPKSPQTLIV